MLSILSVELLQEIGSEVPSQERPKSFRAVSKDIGLSINPLFFAEFVLKTQQLHLETGSLRIVPGYSRRLIVRGEEPAETVKADISDEAIQNLCCRPWHHDEGSWNMRRDDPSWQRDTILGFLPTAPLLDDFELQVDDVGDLEFPPLSIPRLVEQNLGLISLHLSGSGGSAWPRVWNMLRRSANHHLKDIRARYSPELFEYIASSSGIEKLELQYPDLGDPNIFFHRLLPLHAASLEELSFSSDIVDALLKLQKLTHLTMSINEADIAVPVNAV
ncbi:hypothetical protein B0H13DRAFT_1979473, partial [Mycena leptocephala]